MVRCVLQGSFIDGETCPVDTWKPSHSPASTDPPSAFRVSQTLDVEGFLHSKRCIFAGFGLLATVRKTQSDPALAVQNVDGWMGGTYVLYTPSAYPKRIYATYA